MLPKSTRIGLLAPITWSIPPKSYGPYERDVDLEIRGLLAAGYNNLTLYATGQARYPGVETVNILDLPFGETSIAAPHAWEVMHIGHALNHANSHVDILHNHLQFYPVAMNEILKVPMVTTIHSDGSEASEVETFKRFAHLPFISISDNQRQLWPELNWVGTVYNSVDFNQIPFYDVSPESYLVFAGRIRQEKGVHHAIEFARQLRRPLVLAGIVQPQCQEYFDTVVQPAIDDGIAIYVGSLSQVAVRELVSRATAYVALNEFSEPFGNSVAEAMAAGTPVVGTPKGSHLELIIDGQTGILVNSVSEAVRRFSEVENIDRASCRRVAGTIYGSVLSTHAALAAYEATLEWWRATNG